MRHPDDEAKRQQEEPQAGAESAVAEAQPSTSSEAAQAETYTAQADDAPAFDPETHQFAPTAKFATIVIHMELGSDDYDVTPQIRNTILRRIRECRDFETEGCCDEHRAAHRKELAFLTASAANVDAMAYGIQMHSALSTIADKLLDQIRRIEDLPVVPVPDQPWKLEWTEDKSTITVQLLPLDHSPLNRH